MKADFTRNTFSPSKRFARVLLQQGRVQLDADTNEQTAILLHYLRSLAADLIGPAGGPVDNCGFVVSQLTVNQAVPSDFLLSPGRYYVNGVLCENNPETVAVSVPMPTLPRQIVVSSWTADGLQFAKNQYVRLRNAATPSQTTFAQIVDIDQAAATLTLDKDVAAFQPTSLNRVLTFLTQPDLPGANSIGAGTYVAYLDAWERVVTYVEDDAIREVALYGADTATRTRVVAQVKLLPTRAGTVPDLAATLDSANRGFLRARSVKSTASTDPCTISPNARYSGPENQLYRVEIHTGSVDAAGNALQPTFKWSRENGSVVFPIVRSAGANTFVLESLGRDDRFGLIEGDWVEVQDDESVLLNRVESLLQVQSIDRSAMTVTLTGGPTSKVGTRHALLRRWDRRVAEPAEGGLALGPDNAALIVEADGDDWLDLENGIQIRFEKPVAGQAAPRYRTGDYWLIPARVATGDVIWPTEASVDAQGAPIGVALAQMPEGVNHAYAPLAEIRVVANGTLTVNTSLTKTIPVQAV